MRRSLSTALAAAALLNLWALPAGPLAQQTPASLEIAASPAEAGKDVRLSLPSPPAGAVRYEWRVAGASTSSQQPTLTTRVSQPGPATVEVLAFDAAGAQVGQGQLTLDVAAAPAPKPRGGRLIASTASGDAPAKPHPKPRSRRLPVKAAAAGSVTIKDFSFGPSSITVHVGDTVTWVNNGPTDHTATASNGSFDTGTLKKGQSGSHTFTTAGTVSYICSIHPFMKGTVVVAAAAGGDSSAGTGSSGNSNKGTTPATPAQSTGGLPNTGIDVAWVLFSGALLIGSGLLVRRTARG